MLVIRVGLSASHIPSIVAAFPPRSGVLELVIRIIMASTGTALALRAGGITELFYSHTKRSEEETARDAQLGIDRRCFSNLWEEPMMVPHIPLLRHKFLQGSSGTCVEAWFQSAKCSDEDAAKFCFALSNAKLQAQFGRGHLPLSQEQVKYFQDRGLSLTKVHVTQVFADADMSWLACSYRALMKNKKQLFDDDESEELAWADENHILTYVPELQADWEATKNQLMFELQKAKFGPTGQATAKASAVRMVAAGVLHVTEHAEDAVWGDKKNGKGNNRLGKLIATVLQHKNGNGEQELAWSAALQASLEEPAVDTVHYPTTAP